MQDLQDCEELQAIQFDSDIEDEEQQNTISECTEPQQSIQRSQSNEKSSNTTLLHSQIQRKLKKLMRYESQRRKFQQPLFRKDSLLQILKFNLSKLSTIPSSKLKKLYVNGDRLNAIKKNQPEMMQSIKKRQQFMKEFLEKKLENMERMKKKLKEKKIQKLKQLNPHAYLHTNTRFVILKYTIIDIIDEIEQIINFKCESHLKVKPLPQIAISHYINMFFRYQHFFAEENAVTLKTFLKVFSFLDDAVITKSAAVDLYIQIINNLKKSIDDDIFNIERNIVKHPHHGKSLSKDEFWDNEKDRKLHQLFIETQGKPKTANLFIEAYPSASMFFNCSQFIMSRLHYLQKREIKRIRWICYLLKDRIPPLLYFYSRGLDTALGRAMVLPLRLEISSSALKQDIDVQQVIKIRGLFQEFLAQFRKPEKQVKFDEGVMERKYFRIFKNEKNYQIQSKDHGEKVQAAGIKTRRQSEKEEKKRKKARILQHHLSSDDDQYNPADWV